jgi:predicted deacylase
MTRTTDHLPLKPASLGTTRCLTVHRYGRPGARPKAYLQASLHADELPGQLVLHHFMGLLEAAPDAVKGEVVIVPVANPIGQSQHLRGSMIGRFDLDGGSNFNRAFPNLTGAIAERLDGRLGTDAAANTAVIRAVFADAIAARSPVSEVEHLRLELLRLACDTDIALDLHCDQTGPMHLYTTPDLWSVAAPLAADLGARAVMLIRDSGDEPYDEALSKPWWQLAERFGNSAIPLAPCFAATVELRGQADVDDALAAADACGIYRYLQRRGALSGDPGPMPAPQCTPVPLEAVDRLRAPVAGIIVRRAPICAEVKAGDAVVDIVDATTGIRTPVTARADGMVLSHALLPFATAGAIVAKVVGREPLPDRKGNLLSE